MAGGIHRQGPDTPAFEGDDESATLVSEVRLRAGEDDPGATAATVATGALPAALTGAAASPLGAPARPPDAARPGVERPGDEPHPLADEPEDAPHPLLAPPAGELEDSSSTAEFGQSPLLADPPPWPLYRSALDAPLRVKSGLPIALAVGLHVVVFGAAFVLPRLFDGPPPLRKPIIARLVAKGKPLDQRLLPRKEQPPPPAPASSGPRVTTPAPAPPTRSTPAKVATAPARPSAPRRTPTREELMQRALAGVSGSVEREREARPPEEREGAEDGSPEGTAATAEEGDAYFGLVQAEILRHYTLPSIISEREQMSLKATVVAWINADGSIARYQFDQRSGNAFFDAALERAIKASKVPPPPPDRARAIRSDGVALVFTP